LAERHRFACGVSNHALVHWRQSTSGVDQAWAVYRQSLAQYQKTVLIAYQK